MTKKLTVREVAAIKNPGRHPVGDGLYLVVDGSARRWAFRFQINGKRREMGLGSCDDLSLADARAEAVAMKQGTNKGVDPIEAKRVAQVEKIEVPTFGRFSDKLVDDIEFGFRNEKHRKQWRTTLRTYAAPMAGKRIDEIGTDDVLECLKPIWQKTAETASRVRGRIERVLDAAKAKGLRSGENPARWRGHLDALLPKRHKLTRGHHSAMAFADVPAFISDLRTRQSMAALALEFCILTAGRSGEVMGATWDEIDLGAKVWTIPAKRMKAGQEHRVALSTRAIEILEAVAKARVSRFVFPGERRARPLSVMAMAMVLRRMDAKDAEGKPATVHGFRSSFRDWAGEATSFPREVAEAALSHSVGDATERAYRRGDALEKRRELMDTWGQFIEPKAANVVTLKPRTKA